MFYSKSRGQDVWTPLQLSFSSYTQQSFLLIPVDNQSFPKANVGFCSLGLFQRPLFFPQYFSLLLLGKHSQIFCIKKKKKKYPLILPSYKTTALGFPSSSTSWKSLLPLLYFLSPIQSSRYLAYMITRNLSVLNNVHSGLLTVNPNGF